ncbi:hypothetical protein [Mixta intestinalis]|jgi:fructose-specific phosphotransferase system IIC component|uniref:DUF5862 domain-containing protein n=1 Tax=Mixta intestinalis TaxID=1615494 RepID=A0A6P1PZ63_9GAMM|nr:hypothetical protein [Mixta intestinalis]QHM71149.1 hypothetical protein C7M51_01432 [Mixta intestinalis]
MRELTQIESQQISGAVVASMDEALEGFIWGLGDGAMTGMSIAGKFGGAGGFIVGGIAQLVGYALTPFIGGIIGGIGGAIFGRDMIADTLAHYRESVGTGNVSHSLFS